MNLQFSLMPGRHERHAMRKYNNPLFAEQDRTLSQAALTETQRLDHEELVAYIVDLRKLVGEAVSLGPHEQSEVILDLKERLDKYYEQACRLADDQSPNKQAIRKLVEVIMRSVWKGAGNDTVAHQELQQEEVARATHYDLLETPLVADLLDPDSLIREEELLPVLMSASTQDFEAAITLFDPDQLRSLIQQGDALLARAGEDEIWQQVALRLQAMKTRVESLD